MMATVPSHRVLFWATLVACLTTGSHAFLSPTKVLRSAPRLCETVSSESSVEPPIAQPLPPHTFAGRIEAGIKERFQNVDRIIESLRWVEQGYEHSEFVGNQQDPPIAVSSNSNCRQHCVSFVRDLPARQFWDLEPWCEKLASNYKTILKEFQTVDFAELQAQGNNVWAGALTEEAGSYGEGWKTLVLMDRGHWDATNARWFPKTAKAVYESKVPATEVFFASMEPHSEIKWHSDFTNFVLTSHLALDIPDSGKNKCRLTIGDETRQWKNGEVMLFDTSIMHNAVNESDKMRYILMFRVWHPSLTSEERGALQFIYDCLAVPELVTAEDASQRFMAERQVEIMKTFPDLGATPKRRLEDAASFDTKKKKKKKKANRSGGKGFGA